MYRGVKLHKNFYTILLVAVYLNCAWYDYQWISFDFEKKNSQCRFFCFCQSDPLLHSWAIFPCCYKMFPWSQATYIFHYTSFYSTCGKLICNGNNGKVVLLYLLQVFVRKGHIYTQTLYITSSPRDVYCHWQINLMPGITLQWTSIPSRGGENTQSLQAQLNCYGMVMQYLIFYVSKKP